MKNEVLSVLALMLAASFVGAAQDGSKMEETPAAVFKIPFEFYVDSRPMPAGTYEIRPNFLETDIELRNVKEDKIILISAITSLSSRMINKAELAFDVVGQNHYLAEFYMPGMDGMAFNGAAENHKHQVIVSVK